MKPLSAATALLVLALGCGYRFANEPAVFGPDVKQIRVHMFKNESNQPGLERVLDSVGLSLENEVELTLDVRVDRAPGGEPVWTANKLVEVERFSASADANVHAAAKQRALLRLSAEVASRIRDELFQTHKIAAVAGRTAV